MSFQKGIPYTDTLDRLDRAFSPKPGDMLTHDALHAVIQPSDQSRYRGIIAAWMKRLRARGLVPTGKGRARGIGIAFLDGRQDQADISQNAKLVGKRTNKLADRARKVDRVGFTEAENDTQNLQERNLSALAKSFEQANKEMKPPAPVVASNIRLVKKS